VAGDTATHAVEEGETDPQGSQELVHV